MSEPSAADLRKRLDGLTIRDAARLGRRLKNLRDPDPDKLRQIADQLTVAEALVATRTAAVPSITYPDLPVSELRTEIARTERPRSTETASVSAQGSAQEPVREDASEVPAA